MSLYTKYRPKDWDSLVGQDTINHILRNSLRLWRVGHAYIFTGSRGTGKTTSARILAKWVNCENLQEGNPCHICQHCRAFDDESYLDVIEIDGASNNGVDNVRDLIEKARFEPTQWKFKIYIIDEVHMLSDGAFNALLKILEEPPKHVKFILATTEIDKVPETIQSRSLRFDFEKINLQAIIERLTYVITQEWIQASPEVLRIIAESAHGGMRDALTILEQQSIWWVIDESVLRENLAILDAWLIEKLLDTLVLWDEEVFVWIHENLKKKHIRIENFFDQLLRAIRMRMFDPTYLSAFSDYSYIADIIESAYSKIKFIPDSFLLIEITLLRILRRNGKKPEYAGQESSLLKEKESQIPPSKPQEIPKKRDKIPEVRWEKISTPSIPVIPEDTESIPSQRDKTDNPIKNSSDESPKFSYVLLLNYLKETKPALTTDLKSARFELEEKKLRLIFEKEWNYGRVNTAPIKNLIVEWLEKLFWMGWSVECQLGQGTSQIDDSVF